MTVPRRQRLLAGRHALVDQIPFTLPVNAKESPALLAAFTIDADRGQALLPGNELHAVRLPRNRGLLIVTVINYTLTNIGPYVEFSIAIACTHGRTARHVVPAVLFQRRSGVGQYVWDLPVSSEVSVKGGKGIWGMPKHQANLDFRVSDGEMSSQYDLDGQLCMRITVRRPPLLRAPLRELAAVNYCGFRGLLQKSTIYFSANAEVGVGPTAQAQLLLGDHPRMKPLLELDAADQPLFTACLPVTRGMLDDHVESWFLTSATPPDEQLPPEGLERVVGLTNDQAWFEPPRANGR